MLPTSFPVTWPFGSGEEAKIFSKWPPWWPSRISKQNDFSSLLSMSSRCFLPSFKSIGLSFQEKKRKIDFQYGGHGGHLGYPIGMILAIFASHPDAIGLSVQKKRLKDFQNGHHGSHLGFPIGTILAIFDLQVTPMLPTKF